MLENRPEHDFNQLDTQFEDVINHLNTARPVVPPTPASFKAELRSTLRDQVAVLSEPTRKPSLRLVPFSLSLTALLVIVAFMFTQQRPVSAAEIVSRANIAATNTAAFGLNSYSGVRLNWIRNCGDCAKEQLPLKLHTQQRIWFKSPNLTRNEMYTYVTSVSNPAEVATSPNVEDGFGTMIASLTVINDGSIVWWHDIRNNTVYQRSPAIAKLNAFPADFNAVMKRFAQDSDDITLLGTEMVANREAYVLSFIPKSDLPVSSQTASIKSWIDKETYFQLGQEYLNKNGLTLSKWQYIKFEPNPELSSTLFNMSGDFRSVIDVRTPRDEAELAFAWRVVALVADYKIFRPINIPSKFIMERPHHINGGNYSNLPSQQFFYIEGEELAALVFIQQKEAGWSVNGDTVEINGSQGQYREDSGLRVLTFERDGTDIFFQTTQRAMTKEELFHIAETLELVPKE